MQLISRLSLPEMLQAGIEHYQEGRLPQAVKMYAEVLQIDPENAAALHLLGVAAYHYGRHDEALKLVGCAISRRPNVAVFHNSQGVVLATLGRTQEALDEFQHALRLDPECMDAQTNLRHLSTTTEACVAASQEPLPE